MKKGVNTLLQAIRNEKGMSQLVVAVIMAVMLGTIAFGVVSAWKEPIKGLNDAATSRLISE